MGAAVAEKPNNRLPDGRPIRALQGDHNQVAMFSLHKSGFYVPANESIMSVREHDQSIQSGAYKSVNTNNWWRTNEYGFYPKGFETQNLPIGEKIVYVEGGVSYTLNVPDVPVKVNGETIGLRAAIGMGVIKLEKLQYDEDRKIVSVTSDFDPTNDVSVKNIMRPRAWALVDAEGYPMRDKPSNENAPEARYSYVRHSDQLDKKATGYHGSLARDVDFFSRWRVVNAYGAWSYGSGVAVVSRSEGASRDVELVRAASSASAEGGPYRTPVNMTSSLIHLDGSVVDAAETEYARLAEIMNSTQLTSYRQLLDSLRIKE